MAEHSEEDLRRLLGYIGLVRDALRMQNWDVILHRTINETEDEFASTWQSCNHTTLNIDVSVALFQETPERIRNTIVHELTHAQHRDVTEWWEGCTTGNDDVPKSQAQSWDKDFRMHMERFVSWTANRICDGGHIPLYSPTRKYKTLVGCYLLGEHQA